MISDLAAAGRFCISSRNAMVCLAYQWWPAAKRRGNILHRQSCCSSQSISLSARTNSIAKKCGVYDGVHPHLPSWVAPCSPQVHNYIVVCLLSIRQEVMKQSLDEHSESPKRFRPALAIEDACETPKRSLIIVTMIFKSL